MIPYARQSIDKADIAAVAKALRAPLLTQGPLVARFEAALAKKCGARYAVAVGNGTEALHLAYLAAGLRSGDEVITTPNTFVATTNMLLAVGAKPMFADIRLDTYNIDEKSIEGMITPRTKAIVPVHFAGQSADMAAIGGIAKKHDLLVIEDACHALGGDYRGLPVGGSSYSSMTVLSFHAIKSITTGEGGAVLTNDRVFYEKLVALRSHGTKKDVNGFNVMTSFGYNYRLTDIQAALGLSQLTKLGAFVKKRRAAAKLYALHLKDVSGITLPSEAGNSGSAWHLYVIRTIRKVDRLPLMKHLRSKGIGVNFHYPAVYRQPYYKRFRHAASRCPNMELYHGTTLTLPLHVHLTERDIISISRAVASYFA